MNINEQKIYDKGYVDGWENCKQEIIRQLNLSIKSLRYSREIRIIEDTEDISKIDLTGKNEILVDEPKKTLIKDIPNIHRITCVKLRDLNYITIGDLLDPKKNIKYEWYCFRGISTKKLEPIFKFMYENNLENNIFQLNEKAYSWYTYFKKQFQKK